MTHLPPLALTRPRFPCPALLAAAAAAPLGGGREALLAAAMAVRLLAARTGAGMLAAEVRAGRAEAVRGWLRAITVPARTRTAVLRAIAASEGADAAPAAEAVVALTEGLGDALGRTARSQLLQFAERLRRA